MSIGGDGNPVAIGRVLASWIGAIGLVVVLAGGLVNLTQTTNEIDSQLDRNCRLIVQLDRDIRIYLLTSTQAQTISPGQRGSRLFESSGDVRSLLAPFDNLSC